MRKLVVLALFASLALAGCSTGQPDAAERLGARHAASLLTPEERIAATEACMMLWVEPAQPMFYDYEGGAEGRFGELYDVEEVRVYPDPGHTYVYFPQNPDVGDPVGTYQCTWDGEVATVGW
ncbi:hypothetical protein [Gulosibacter sp. ACHW.36C]|uniref:Lipoprotein n=1 Tax=Gulosibacter sediminis TaxID=1729695 RepID=A0ABY4MUY8_9MICO|nr:hypothetical protein [Gulosibacter sediminis]UQN14241.1 hypothetical protein M3M28_09290 [Gulosibacter sediminis]